MKYALAVSLLENKEEAEAKGHGKVWKEQIIAKHKPRAKLFELDDSNISEAKTVENGVEKLGISGMLRFEAREEMEKVKKELKDLGFLTQAHLCFHDETPPKPCKLI